MFVFDRGVGTVKDGAAIAHLDGELWWLARQWRAARGAADTVHRLDGGVRAVHKDALGRAAAVVGGNRAVNYSVLLLISIVKQSSTEYRLLCYPTLLLLLGFTHWK